ncbi:uncharacterized protein F4822DRAFT_228522 [Hypoxylon trugodes]|uniref:uncharacterized protein n=1 Tax=Hypoxylon trugodes TaxID=326681 RepID=UPI0021906706|nr:uncharacterized protein F4822DRAFT_228522 [Hypoxylon trugodes]KAI1390199.1 hypothetical protein F4822DRAFT_228522 [Hypoxylon trugodes]
MADKQISTWTWFQVPTSKTLDISIFKPLLANESDYFETYYGRVIESPEQHVLVIPWRSRAAYDAFTKSSQYEEMMNNLTALSSSKPQTQAINFGKIAYYWHLVPYMEIKTVYFPSSVSTQTREQVSGIKGLVLSMPSFGRQFAHLSPHRGLPCSGWIDDPRIWEGQDTLACIWCHYWKDKETEHDFKTKERRPPKNGETYRPLALEKFEQDLKDLGAIGWKEIHIDFERLH